MVNNIKISDYRNALVEVEAVLNCLKVEDYCKIPKEVIETINMNKNEDYLYEYDDNLDYEYWNLMPETKALLYNLFKNYLATEEQKHFFIEKEKYEIMKIEQEKSKKYDSNVLFKKQEKNQEIKALMEIKQEKWYEKIFNKIRKMLNRNKHN